MQLNKLKLGIENCTEVTLKVSSNIVSDSNDENNFPHKLLLTNTQVSKLPKAFANGSSANIKLSKTQLRKIGQSMGFLGRLLGPLLKIGLPLMTNVLKPLAKNTIRINRSIISNATIHKKMFGLGRHPSDLASRLSNLASRMTTLIISDEELDDILKIVKSLGEPGLLIKGVSQTIKNEAKEQKRGFMGMLLDTLGANLLGNLLTGKATIRAGEGTIKAGQDF